MCGAPQAMAALSVASTAASLFSKYKQANAQLDVLEEQRRIQAEEISDKASAEMGERVRQARRERARLRVAAGEAGVSGNSFEATLKNSAALQNQDLALIEKGAETQDRGSQARYSSNVARVDRPNLITAGLQIAQAGAAGYSQGVGIKNSLKGLKV